MPEPIHLLTGASGDPRRAAVACGARDAGYASFDPTRVTCPRCLESPPSRVRRAGGMSEKAWLQQVRTYAKAQGWLSFHTLHSQGSEPGWPDLALLKPPVLVLAELKTARGRLTPHQRQWLEGLRQVTTVTAHLWRPEDWETVVQRLRGDPARDRQL